MAFFNFYGSSSAVKIIEEPTLVGDETIFLSEPNGERNNFYGSSSAVKIIEEPTLVGDETKRKKMILFKLCKDE